MQKKRVFTIYLLIDIPQVNSLHSYVSKYKIIYVMITINNLIIMFKTKYKQNKNNFKFIFRM